MTGIIEKLKTLSFIPTIELRLSSIVELDIKYNLTRIRKTKLKNLCIIPDANIGFYSISKISKNWGV